MMSQLHTLHMPNPRHHSSEQPGGQIGLANSDPRDSLAPDQFRGLPALAAALDSLPLYVGCPSRLKLLGWHINSMAVAQSRSSAALTTLDHDEDLSW